eukprot:TRINITY_DN6526_c0_g1_i1.p1 TRINITY_DN6526_c0_g1~~TRINITY_DN6526_c0_g1_i1.p1  ORF type:complete len:187 (-),score=39.10 TRINITY_DN6526_c0_g1_i1:10-504(-)
MIENLGLKPNYVSFILKLRYCANSSDIHLLEATLQEMKYLRTIRHDKFSSFHVIKCYASVGKITKCLQWIHFMKKKNVENLVQSFCTYFGGFRERNDQKKLKQLNKLITTMDVTRDNNFDGMLFRMTDLPPKHTPKNSFSGSVSGDLADNVKNETVHEILKGVV